MTHYCAPDLPFWQTVAWYAKQFAAVMIIVGVMFGVVMAVLLIDEWNKDRKRFK